MGPPSYSARGGCTEAADTGDKLQQEPVAQDDECGDGNEEKEDQREDSRTRKQNNVRAHNSGDSPARAQGREGRVQIKEDMAQARANPAHQIEEEIGNVAEVVFDVVAKDPEKQHVPGDVRPTAVQEHAGNNREEG